MTTPTPRTADEAARLLVDEGEHVHLVSEGHSNCLSGDCEPWTPRGEA
jgi:hypothetical protein